MAAIKLFYWQLRCMIIKELLSNLKDPKTRVILILPVIVQSLLFGYVATYDLDHVPYALLDLSHSSVATELTQKLDGSSAFYRVATLENAHEIAAAIDSGRAILVISIPADFAKKLSSGGVSPIQVITDGRNTMTATLAQGYVNSIVSSFNAQRNPKLDAVQVETIAWYNPNLITRWTFLPALTILLSLVQVLMLGGLSVAREREMGTFDQLLVTPLSPTQILLGKATVPLLTGIFQSSLVLLICRFWFQIPMAGDLFSMFLAIAVFILSCTGLGLSISAIAQSMQQVMVYSFVLIMPMVLLSGLATPVANMPEALQILTYINPMRFALEAVRRVYLEGTSAFEMLENFIPMLIVAAITLPLAGWLFRHDIS